MPAMSKGACEAKVCELFTKYHKDMVGRGTKHVRTMLSDELLLIEQDGVLTKEEQNILRFDENGRLIKDIRRRLFEAYRNRLEKEIEQVIGGTITFLAFDIQPVNEKIRVIYSVERLG
ncbi:Na-translocating system protein MpsC family protein [Thermoflavimicrobium daqui]|jgi:uncharacterized protein YbcI|uniref:Na+-translocating membrane potential-generating system MpsC domain-containing protein n=1 Tax=Thermoflavimicrobium daqui TaxID=2137476 RepID=A0A364KA35_9BACL|nr:Na-translocating system protein MpsC family protein [Thermoflavimicrobium daqui]RAL27080.1 hypothetical protein DL897_03340 [Thermoflavimicrobium daqui]